MWLILILIMSWICLLGWGVSDWCLNFHVSIIRLTCWHLGIQIFLHAMSNALNVIACTISLLPSLLRPLCTISLRNFPFGQSKSKIWRKAIHKLYIAYTEYLLLNNTSIGSNELYTRSFLLKFKRFKRGMEIII
jgi:hypothetical protein